MRVVTRAKVNLHLDIIRRRRDGFHDIETVLQSVNLFDRIDVEFNNGGRVRITCTDPSIPVDGTNLAARAIDAMRTICGGSLGATIHIEKKIPTGAGLGGGSSNAAGVMLAVCRARYLDVPFETLTELAAGIGSDVPFFLRGGTMLGRGRGEVLTPLETIRRGFFLIVKPPVSIPTAWAYGNFNSRLTKHRPRINLNAVNSVLARFPVALPSFRNALEDVVCPSHPAIAQTLDELLRENPCFASMSGSGSAVFAVFDDCERADALAERFSVRGFFTSVVEPAKRAVDIE